jgi:hypothetical protein
MRRNSSVGIATGYGLDGCGSIHDSGKRFFSSPQRQARLWGPRSLLYNGYRRLLLKRPGPDADHSPPSSGESRIVELYLHSFLRLHGVVVN